MSSWMPFQREKQKKKKRGHSKIEKDPDFGFDPSHENIYFESALIALLRSGSKLSKIYSSSKKTQHSNGASDDREKENEREEKEFDGMSVIRNVVFELLCN
ncbi:MAG: hypothetical protein Q8P67_29085 [archaeon]|nr:hypothetical protein [archaeon]